MIPFWVITLLDTVVVEEFSYHRDYEIHIIGKKTNNEWVVDVSVRVLPYFAWGCNGLHTNMRGSFRDVIKYYLTVVLNQLCEYGVKGKKDALVETLREYTVAQ